MVWIGLILVLILGIFLLGHLGLPEKPLPPPPEPPPGRIMKGAEPWRFEGDSGVAFLISHGFEGTAFNTRPLGEFIHSLGHTAIGVLLPGHGTNLEDFSQSRYYHWRDYLERVYLEERSKYRRLFLVGFSMGGTLCLDIAARHADSFRPAGLITISSPVFLNGFYNGQFVLHSPSAMLTGLVRIFGPFIKVGSESKRPQSLERMNPWIGYDTNVYAVDTIHSFKRHMRKVRSGLYRISTPYCNIMAANDRTVPSPNQIYIYNKIQSQEKRAYMFILPPDLSTMHSLLTHAGANKQVFRFLETFIKDTLAKYETRRNAFEKLTFWARLKNRLWGTVRRRAPENLVDPGAGD